MAYHTWSPSPVRFWLDRRMPGQSVPWSVRCFGAALSTPIAQSKIKVIRFSAFRSQIIIIITVQISHKKIVPVQCSILTVLYSFLLKLYRFNVLAAYSNSNFIYTFYS